MKAWRIHICLGLLAVLLANACLPNSLADDAGVLTEGELNTWIVQVLQKTREEQPQNAPALQDSLTEDGYAFIYSFATLYYNKPVLDDQSILNGFSITDEGFDAPRGICLSAPSQMLMDAYGWQNPFLTGDGASATLYLLDQLPQSAYWAWAQHTNGQITAVQCTIHVRTTEGLYTDAGIRYQVTDGMISALQVYGLNQSISLDDVQGNLSAMRAVQSASNRNAPSQASPDIQGSHLQSHATPFGAEDLSFSGIHFSSLTEVGANASFGAPSAEEWIRDDTGEWLYTTQRDGLTLTHVLNENRTTSRLGMLVLTRPGLKGPRNLQLGDPLQNVLTAFQSQGTGQTQGTTALLYGDGITPPYGTLENENGYTIIRYAALIPDLDGQTREVTLHLSFIEGALTEIMLYSW